MLLTRAKHAIDKRDMTSKMRLVTLKKFFNFYKTEMISLRIIVRINNIMSIKVLSTVSGMYEIFNECYFPKKILKGEKWNSRPRSLRKLLGVLWLLILWDHSHFVSGWKFDHDCAKVANDQWLRILPTDMFIVLYDFSHEKEGSLWL